MFFFDCVMLRLAQRCVSEVLPIRLHSATHRNLPLFPASKYLLPIVQRHGWNVVDDHQTPEVIPCLGSQRPKLLGPDGRYESKARGLRLNFTAPQYHTIPPPFTRSSLQYPLSRTSLARCVVYDLFGYGSIVPPSTLFDEIPQLPHALTVNKAS